MKKLLSFPLIILMLFTSCNKAEDTPTPPTRFVVNVFKQILENGQIVEKPVNAIIHLWRAEGREFDVAASGEDIFIGYAYDKISKTWVNAEYGGLGVAMNEEIAPGRYFVYVLLNKSNSTGSQAYSSVYIDVKEGERYHTKKTFSHNVGTRENEAWNKNK